MSENEWEYQMELDGLMFEGYVPDSRGYPSLPNIGGGPYINIFLDQISPNSQREQDIQDQEDLSHSLDLENFPSPLR